MTNVLLYGDTERSAALRHEIPITIIDPFFYAEVDGRVYVTANPIERDRMAKARPDAELLELVDLGFYELMRSGMSRPEVFLELVSRAAQRTGVREAIVDFDFPLGVAERLRADGIGLTVGDEEIKARRRAKSDRELAGIRLAQIGRRGGDGRRRVAASASRAGRWHIACRRSTAARRGGARCLARGM